MADVIIRPSNTTVTVSPAVTTVVIDPAVNDVVVEPAVTTVTVDPAVTTAVISPIMGSPGATGPAGPPGPGGQYADHGSFYDTTTQNNLLQVNTMQFNSLSEASGVSIGSLTQVTVAQDGIYNIQFSAQFDKTDAGDDTVEIWLAKNNIDLAWSSTIVTLHGNDAKNVPAWNFMLSLDAGEYVELKWYSADAQMRILARAAEVAPIRPAIPSLILTVQQVMHTQQGPAGDPGVYVGPTAPVDTSLLWVDTS